MSAFGAALGMGINRNIVECKVKHNLIQTESDFCINRNIVECKGFETFRELASVQFSINRNIVECKVSIIFNTGTLDDVLIET